MLTMTTVRMGMHHRRRRYRHRHEGYCLVFPSEDRKEFRDVQLRHCHLRNLYKGNMIVVEDDTAKGRRHEVFPAAGWSKIAPAMEIEEPTKKGIDHIEADIIPDQREVDMTPAPEKTSPSREKIEHSDDDANAQDQETDCEEERGVWIPIQSTNASHQSLRDNPGQPRAALRQLRVPGRGATAPAMDRRRRRGRSPSHRIWAGHS
jgi:hypothetical protein